MFSLPPQVSYENSASAETSAASYTQTDRELTTALADGFVTSQEITNSEKVISYLEFSETLGRAISVYMPSKREEWDTLIQTLVSRPMTRHGAMLLILYARHTLGDNYANCDKEYIASQLQHLRRE
jgi:sorbitol-specific phosphotransferase system component IIBC